MILNNEIINKIKAKSNLLFDKAGDFAVLSSLIFKETGRTIGVSTLKRLFNYISDDHRTSEYTMNTVALYLGYPSWREYLIDNKIDRDWNFDNSSIYISDLEIGTKIEVKYLNRVVCFSVVSFNGKNMLQVVEATNSSLLKGDVLAIDYLQEGQCLEAKTVYRGEAIGNYKTNGELKEIVINGL